jgi:hypothetical protein
MSGWNLYARAAPFADCRRFTPPEGTAVLCDERPPAKRPGPFGYVWDLECVARKRFELGPKTGGKLGEFAKRAITHQPLDYVGWVAIDLVKYIDPGLVAPRAYDAPPREILSFGWRDMTREERLVQAMSRSYKGTQVRVHWQKLLAFYQNLARPSGWALAVFFLLTFAGLSKARGAIRLGITLLGLSAFGLYLIPVLTLSYSFRYGVPPETFIIPSGVLGAVCFWPKLIARRSGSGAARG